MAADGLILNVFHYAIIKANLPVIKYLVEDYKINLALLFQIAQREENEGNEERIKLDHIFTLKCALDTGNKEIFKYVLESGSGFYKEEMVQQFIDIIIKNKDTYKDSLELIEIIL